MKKGLLIYFILIFFGKFSFSQKQSIARKWNEVLLQSIRNDLARPTVLARNLFHISAAMSDAWAVFDYIAKPYFLNQNNHDYFIPYRKTDFKGHIDKNRDKAISYAAYRLLIHRYEISPGYKKTKKVIDSLFKKLGYNKDFKSTNYKDGDAAALGNYIAKQIINYTWNDGANEKYFYTNLFYEPKNDPLILKNPGIKGLKDPNRWQPLAFEKFIDQSGNELAGSVPEFLGPEWGSVKPFSISQENLTIKTRNGFDYPIYYDPGPPPKFLNSKNKINKQYVWNHSFVSIWSSHLDPNDNVFWDISPSSIGNLNFENANFDIEGLNKIYKDIDGGDYSKGHKLNPHTKKPYEKQVVPRGDYTRVIAEFWADGPDSETPPGHWFTILNYVSYHNKFKRKFEGKGEIVDALEWDIKSYFLLGGAMHDAAIAAWGLKGYYDYVRPISALRYMAQKGQSSDPNLPNYNPIGIKLEKDILSQLKR